MPDQPTAEEIEEAADLARDFGLIGMSSAGHRKLAMLVAAIRRKTGKAGRPRGTGERVSQRHDIEPEKPVAYPPEIVKGTGWSVR